MGGKKGGEMVLINLTPHDLVLYDEAGETEIARILQAGEVARVKTQATQVGELEVDGHSVSVVETSYGEIENLPEPHDGTTYVVSIIVAQAVRGLMTWSSRTLGPAPSSATKLGTSLE
jgi:hypothetical protein